MSYQTEVRCYFENLPENEYEFIVTAFESSKESSPVEATGKTYGLPYQTTLDNKNFVVVTGATALGNGAAVKWSANNATSESGFFAHDLIYKKDDGNTATVRVKTLPKTTILPAFESDLVCKTLFLPETACIDTFYVETAVTNVVSLKPILSKNDPCEILAYNFDLGGRNVAFYDTRADDYNLANQFFVKYRNGLGDYNSDAVMTRTQTVGSTPLLIGDVQIGEWLRYTIHVLDAGEYEFDMNVSPHSVAAPNDIYGEIDNVTFFEVKDNAYTAGGYYNFNYFFSISSTPKPKVYLTAGTHIFKYYPRTVNLIGYKFVYVGN